MFSSIPVFFFVGTLKAFGCPTPFFSCLFIFFFNVEFSHFSFPFKYLFCPFIHFAFVSFWVSFRPLTIPNPFPFNYLTALYSFCFRLLLLVFKILKESFLNSILFTLLCNSIAFGVKSHCF